MPDTDTSRESQRDQDTGAPHRFFTWRSVLVLLALLAIVLMALLPPLLNVNRFKRRIVTSISTSLGRPVHLDRVSLVLLPLPGFELENFVVAEDPAFGNEPVIHANSVRATLRISSLWRRRVEFSRISLQEPSVNLVQAANGRWNVESILLQAARIPAAPTAQAKPSAEPRFPYVEATGARVNVKSGLEKLPFSFTEADFALWLPNPQQWRIRLVAKPARTDTDASDTGTISLEGSLGHAERFDQIPVELSAEWKNAPLGEASRVLTGRDAGLRGDLRVNLAAKGTLGASLIKSTINLRNARRADFVPDHPLDLSVECQATSAETFHAFHEVRCAWLPFSLTSNEPALVALTGDVPDIKHRETATFQVGTPGLPAAILLDWLRVASRRVPADVIASGMASGTFSSDLSLTMAQSIQGRLDLKSGSVTGGPLGTTPVAIGDLNLASAALAEPGLPARHRVSGNAALPAGTFLLAPTTIALGAREPASLEGRFDATGYSLHLTGSAMPSRLLALAAAFPQFGDGLAEVFAPPGTQPGAKDGALHPEIAVRVDLVSTRAWFGAQTWSKASIPVATKPARHRR